MERHSCEPNQMVFYNVQPVSFSLDLIKALYESSIDKTLLEPFKCSQTPEWLSRFQYVGNAYQSLIPIKVDFPNLTLLKEDLAKPELIVNKHYPLVDYIQFDQIETTLFFDINTWYFVMLYKIPVCASLTVLQALVDFNAKDATHDLYNTIRNLLVKETETSIISRWAEATQKAAITSIQKLMSTVYKLKDVDDNAVYIQTNTGNITNIVHCEDHDNCGDFNQALIKLNTHAERIDYHADPLALPDGTIYDFNGRFHTIILGNIKDKHRFIPVQFHMQYMWIYLLKMYALMDHVNQEIMTKHPYKTLKKLNDVVDHIIQKIQYLSLFHRNFKRAIESDNKNIYAKIETLWHIDETLKGTEQYVNNFKDYLNRKHLKHTNQSNQRQSNILFLISMLQMVSLVGVWSAYLSLISQGNFEMNQGLLRIFGTQENLIRFNMYLPVLFLLAIVTLWFLGFMKKKH